MSFRDGSGMWSGETGKPSKMARAWEFARIILESSREQKGQEKVSIIVKYHRGFKVILNGVVASALISSIYYQRHINRNLLNLLFFLSK
jgi:hypothetical protein